MPPRLRVLVLIDGLGFGGAEMLLSEYVAGAPRAALDVHVAALYAKDGNPAVARIRDAGVEPVILGVGGLLHPSSLRTVRRHVAQVAPDIVHSHLGYSDFMGGIAARSLGLPAVGTIHVVQPETSVRDRFKVPLLKRVRATCMGRVIAVSEAGRRVCIEQHWAPAGKVVVAHNGVTGEMHPGAGVAIRAELGLAPDDLVVGMLSVLRPGKGHDVAVEAIDQLRRDFPRLRLVVVGDGPARDEVATHLARLGEAGVLAGHRDDVMEVLDAFDVLIHPSEWEAFPTALLEAMAAGVPVVASAVGGVPEIVTDGETGFLVSAPVDPEALAGVLRPLLGDAEMRQQFSHAARRRFVGEFSIDAWMHRLRMLYDEVIDEHTNARRNVRPDRAT